MVTLMDPNDPQEERVFLALRRLQLPHLRDTLSAVLYLTRPLVKHLRIAES